MQHLIKEKMFFFMFTRHSRWVCPKWKSSIKSLIWLFAFFYFRDLRFCRTYKDFALINFIFTSVLRWKLLCAETRAFDCLREMAGKWLTGQKKREANNRWTVQVWKFPFPFLVFFRSNRSFQGPEIVKCYFSFPFLRHKKTWKAAVTAV